MTANGIACVVVPADDPSPRLQALDGDGLRAELARHVAAGVPEVVVEGDAGRILAAFEAGLVTHVTCFIEPALALAPASAVTAGLGFAIMDEAPRLVDVRHAVHDGVIRVDGRLPGGS